MAKEISLSRGLVTIVDDADYEWLSKFKWYAVKGRCGAFYASRKEVRIVDGKRRCRSYEMQREILDPERVLPRNIKADHMDGDTLNNCRENLRLVDDSISNVNRRLFKTNTSGFRGVYFRKKFPGWYVQVKCKGITYSGGTYPTAKEAAAAYNAKAIELFGSNARLNIIEDAVSHEY